MDFVNTKEAAAIIGVNDRRVRLIAAQLGGIKIGSAQNHGYVFDRDAVEAYAAKRRKRIDSRV